MKIFMRTCAVVFFVLLISSGCSQVQVPEYPGAIEDQEIKAQFIGITFGKVKRMITEDPYDRVFSYYTDLLAAHDPEIISHALEDGRQGAITITKSGKHSVTVVVQEFKKEGKVGISYMN